MVELLLIVLAAPFNLAFDGHPHQFIVVLGRRARPAPLRADSSVRPAYALLRLRIALRVRKLIVHVESLCRTAARLHLNSNSN